MLGLSKSNESELVKTESEAIVPVLEQQLFIIIAHIVKQNTSENEGSASWLADAIRKSKQNLNISHKLMNTRYKTTSN